MNLHPLIANTVALWQFQNTYKDDSGNGLDMVTLHADGTPATPAPFVHVSDSTGAFVTNDPCLFAVNLDVASGTRLQAPSSSLLRITGPLTIEWILMWQYTFVWYMASLGSPSKRLFEIQSNIINKASVSTPTNGDQAFPGTDTHTWALANEPVGGDYHPFHYAYTRDASGNWLAYKNGVVAGAGFATSASASDGTELFCLGGGAANNDAGGGPRYASVRILNYARSAPAIFADATAVLAACGDGGGGGGADAGGGNTGTAGANSLVYDAVAAAQFGLSLRQAPRS